MATRTRKPAAAKPAVSPAQVIEDGPMVGGVLAEALTPEPTPEPEPLTTVDEPVADGVTEPEPEAAYVAPNDLATLEAEPSRDQLIREAAHRRFVERGHTPGDPVQDWLQAEAEVDAAARHKA